MQGLMQDWPLTVDRILEHAAAWRPDGEIFTAAAEGAPMRRTFAQLGDRCRRLASALAAQGVKRGDVVAVLGANSARQLEAWYAIIGMGAVCQPLNPALAPDHLKALLAASGAKVAFADPEVLAAVEPALRASARLQRVVVMGEGVDAPQVALKAAMQDTMVEQAVPGGPWGGVDENAPAVLGHGVGVTGEPRSTVWSHRSVVLQGMISCGRDALDISGRDVVFPLVPFWRAAGWGAVFAAPMAGAKLVLAGARTDALSVRVLADRESVSLIIASPAQLQALNDQYRSESRRPNGLKRVIAAGACCPPALAKSWRDSFGVDARSAWGLMETSSVGGVSDPTTAELRPPFGLELELMDADGRILPHDGVAVGRLKARGPVVAGGYFPGDRATGQDGYLDTGDMASVDADGRVRILGRVEDLITVDGALVSPHPIEDAAMEHPSTDEAAVIDGPANEGPVLVVQRRPGAISGRTDYLRFLAARLDAAMTPVDVLFVDALPRDGAGRVDRKGLRQRLAARVAAPSIAPEPPPSPEPEPAAQDAEPALLAAVAATAVASDVLYAPEPVETAPEVVSHGDIEPAEAPLSADVPYAPPAEASPIALEAAEIPALTEAPEDPAASSDPPVEPLEDLVAATESVAPRPEDDTIALDDPELFDVPAANLKVRPAFTPALKPRLKRRAPGPSGIFLSFTALLGLLPAILIAAGVIGVRADLIDWSVGHDQLMTDWPFKLGMVGVVSGVLGLFTALMAGFGRYWRRALVGLLVPIFVLAGLVGYKARSDSFPPVHDVATDWNNPIMFSRAVVRLRGADANPIDQEPSVPASAGAYMNRLVADVNAETCPEARPVNLQQSVADAYARARLAVLAEGLELVRDDPKAGRLEATATEVVLGLKDDLAVRVTPTGAGAKIDFRSISRYGEADLGGNCARVTRLVQAVRP